MDTRTGEIYPSVEAARAAGVPEKDLVTGPSRALRRLSKLVKLRQQVKYNWKKAKKARRAAKRARARNR